MWAITKSPLGRTSSRTSSDFSGELRPLSLGFIASGSFDTPLISVIYGRILKPFGVVIVTTVLLGFVWCIAMLDKWSCTSVIIA